MFNIITIIDEEHLSELSWLSDSGVLVQSSVEVGSETSEVTVSEENRRTTKFQLHPKMYTDLCESLEEYVNDGTVVNQLEILVYNIGDHFAKHVDWHDSIKVDSASKKRIWSTVTLLDKSEDLEGGELNIYRGESKETVELEVGQTVIFRSEIEHEVLPVKRGYRKTLVTWLVSLDKSYK